MKAMIKFSLGVAALHLLLAGMSVGMHDREHTIMFLVGTGLWIIVAFIYDKAVRDQEQEE
jgi:hypothetical protein